MAQVSVNIAGRAYRMACEDGQEPHLEQLARDVDAKITEMKGAFGEIGDQRLTIMAAIAMTDERTEAHRKIASLQSRIDQLQADVTAARASVDSTAERAASAISETAARIERIARALDTPKVEPPKS